VNDTNSTGRKLENAWRNLYEADIDERDRKAIEELVQFERKANEGSPKNTLIADLDNLRRAAEDAEKPLIEWDLRSFREFRTHLIRPRDQGGRELDPDKSGYYGYNRALVVLFKWMDNEPEYGDYSWIHQIQVKSPQGRSIRSEDLLTEEDIESLKDAALNPRDRALIEFFADTAARVSLASQLRVGDIQGLETDDPHYVPNPNGEGHKGAPDVEYPLVYSQAELRAYINNYHIDTRDEAPLWHVNRGYDFENPVECALSGDRIRDVLKECAKRAGISKPVNPHNFRHTAITRLRRTDYTDQEIRHIAGWADSRMLDRYDHTTAKELNRRIRERAGLVDESEAEEATKARPCSNCRQRLKPSIRFCPNCGFGATADAHLASKILDEHFLESAVMASGETARHLLVVSRLLEEVPALREVLLAD
jgi:integrase